MPRSDNSAGALVVFFVIIVMVASLAGWFMNLGQLIGMSFEPLTGLAVVRVIGVFVAPLGAVLGYF